MAGFYTSPGAWAAAATWGILGAGRVALEVNAMDGIDPWAYLQDLARRIDSLEERDQLEAELDRVEYLMEVLDPELQGPAYDLIDRLRQRLGI
jgi:hypothetical protein